MYMEIILDWIVSYEDYGEPHEYYIEQNDLETFCTILRKNGIKDYSVRENDVYGGTRNRPKSQILTAEDFK